MNDVFFRWLEVYTNLLKYWIAYADIDGFRVFLSSRFAEKMCPPEVAMSFSRFHVGKMCHLHLLQG